MSRSTFADVYALLREVMVFMGELALSAAHKVYAGEADEKDGAGGQYAQRPQHGAPDTNRSRAVLKDTRLTRAGY